MRLQLSVLKLYIRALGLRLEGFRVQMTRVKGLRVLACFRGARVRGLTLALTEPLVEPTLKNDKPQTT